MQEDTLYEVWAFGVYGMDGKRILCAGTGLFLIRYESMLLGYRKQHTWSRSREYETMDERDFCSSIHSCYQYINFFILLES